MEEAVYKFKSVVEAEQRNSGPQQKRPLTENENPIRRSNQEQGMDKYIKRQKGSEGQPIAICVEAGVEACGKTTIEKGVIRKGNKLDRPPLLSTYKETELSEDLNVGMERVFRDYRRSLNQAKDPLTPGDDMMEFDVKTQRRIWRKI